MEEIKTNIEDNRLWLKRFSFFRKIPWEIVLRYSIFVAGTAVLVLLFPHGEASQYSDLKLNLISSREIIAPFDFEIIKSEAELKEERIAARASIMPVFGKNPETGVIRIRQLDSLLTDLGALVLSASFVFQSDSLIDAGLSSLNEIYRVNLSSVNLSFDRSVIVHSWWDSLAQELADGLDASYLSGILDRSPETINTSANSIAVVTLGIERRISMLSVFSLEDAKKNLLDRLKNVFPEGDSRIKLGYELALNFIEPSLIYDHELTERRREEAASKVALAKGIVLKDERIIDSNERVSQTHLDKLRSLAQKRLETSAEEGGLAKILPLLGKIIYSAGLLFLFAYFVFKYRVNAATNKNFILILLLLLAPLLFLQYVIDAAGISKILFPGALAAMLTTIFFGYRIGYWFLLVLSLLAGAMQGFDFQITMLSLIVGASGVISVKSLRSRTQLLTSALYLMIAHVIFIPAFNFIQITVGQDFFQQLGIALLNSGLTPIFVLGFAIILGNLFDITTDLTLLELSDLNRPLLKQLAATAPGTYHHSLMVGTLAESAAEAVHANPLLARTAAYYHDIGKIEKRDYFIENQVVFNPHDTIPPEESARVLNSHVLSGLEMAEKHRLPQVIKDAITQHHGTGLMQFFYVKASKKQQGHVDEKTYKYPGPLPVSKESGIIMLADSVEAAVRSMGQAPAEEIRDRVQKIIEGKFAEGQLDQCELSLRDLQTVEDIFVSTLLAQSHQRIAYPSRIEVEAWKEDAEANKL